ncbi:6-phosphofructokinase [Ktedonospora formicarum]|uniref:6-phosphofructokinase n=1 Tax=Ktedonospora formicarum TaxID=2778364 RepID=UPI001F1E406F|nr:6-phosphofructokinase [Ktedonospora formicarum]
MASLRSGNLLIGQSGGATAVINASLVGAVEAALNDTRIKGVYGMHYGIAGLLNEDLLDLRQQPDTLWPQLLYTPSAALGSCRYKLKEQDIEKALTIFRRYDIRYLLYIGGNDSADTAHRLALAARKSNYELYAISIPKTIDNDLPFTDHSPGYGSAARFLATATQDSTMNTLSMPSHYPVKIIETMGRNAGWLAASSALGKHDESDAPHIILIPEQTFRAERFLAQVEEAYRRYGYVVVVASEALRDEQGQALGASGQVGVDAFQHPLLSGTAQALVELVKQELHLRARFDKPGDFQRMSSRYASPVDRQEAYLVGQEAVKAALRGENDKMITLVRHDEPTYHCSTGLVDLKNVANVQHLIPETYFDAHNAMVTPAFYTYAQPLIGEPLTRYPRVDTTKVITL